MHTLMHQLGECDVTSDYCSIAQSSFSVANLKSTLEKSFRGVKGMDIVARRLLDNNGKIGKCLNFVKL